MKNFSSAENIFIYTAIILVSISASGCEKLDELMPRNSVKVTGIVYEEGSSITVSGIPVVIREVRPGSGFLGGFFTLRTVTVGRAVSNSEGSFVVDVLARNSLLIGTSECGWVHEELVLSPSELSKKQSLVSLHRMSEDCRNPVKRK